MTHSSPEDQKRQQESEVPQIVAYRSWVERLTLLGTQSAISPLHVLETVLARENLARYLCHNASVTLRDFEQTAELDRRLRALAPQLVDVAGSKALADWHKAIAPEADGWWWTLHTHQATETTIWSIITALCWLLALSLGISLSLKLYGSGAEYSAVIGFVSSFLTASALTKWGQQHLDLLMTKLNFRASWLPVLRACVAVIVLLIIVALRLYVPRAVALYHYHTGRQAYYADRVSDAIKSFELALNLDPELIQSHYAMGNAYERLHMYDSAINSYNLAYMADPQFVAVANNLARLYILHLNNNEAAIALLHDVIDQMERREAELSVRGETLPLAEQWVLYTLYKNRAWALVNLGFWNQAELDLDKAIGLLNQMQQVRAAPYCLYALMYERQQAATGRDMTQAALDYWRDCKNNYQLGQDDAEPIWITQARERVP